MHKVRVLKLVTFATAALAVLGVSTAHAGKLDVGSQPAVLRGHSDTNLFGEFQEHILSINGTSGQQFLVKCKTASFEGTTQGSSLEEATVTPTYGTGKGEASESQGCTLAGIKAQVLMNGCKYTITGSGQAANTANVDIAGCTFGKRIEVKTVACQMYIGAQNGLSHIVGTNLNAQEVTLQATVQTILVEEQVGSACPGGVFATFSGNTVVKSFKDSGTQLAFKHQHQYFEVISGEQVSIQST